MVEKVDRFTVVTAGDGHYNETDCEGIASVLRILREEFDYKRRDEIAIHDFYAECFRIFYTRINDADGNFAGYVSKKYCVSMKVVSSNGKLLNFRELISRKESEKAKHSTWWSRYAFWNGDGPVPGTSKSRGGYGRFRKIHTHAERKLNELVIHDDGEIQARKSRVGTSLPNSRDDIWREEERSWKSQCKGRKSWDR